MKYVTGFIIGLIFLAPVNVGAVSAGVEFQTPLVQRIVSLLHDRIAELTERVRELENQTQCSIGGVSHADELRREYAIKMNNIDEDIVALRQENTEAKSEMEELKRQNGSIATAKLNYRRRLVKENTNEIESLENNRQKLEIELRRKLIELGEY